MIYRVTRLRLLVSSLAVVLVGLFSLFERTTQAQADKSETLASRCYRNAGVDLELDGVAAQESEFARGFLDRVEVDSDFDPASCAWPYITDQQAIDSLEPRSRTGKLGTLSLRLQVVWRSHLRSSLSDSAGDARRFEALANTQWLAWVGLVWTPNLGGSNR